MNKTYDSKCYDLAVVFLEDVVEPVPVLLAHELASVIQEAIEDFILERGIET